MAHIFAPTTAAFNVEQVRAALYNELEVPRALLRKALAKLDTQLEAKETKFFTFQGQVMEKVEVAALAIQQSAADKILQAAGVYVRQTDNKPTQPVVAVEVDSKTGVIRLVVGSSSAPGPMLSSDASVPLALEAAPERVLESPELEEPQNGVEVIKVRRGGLPIEIYNTLVSDE